MQRKGTTLPGELVGSVDRLTELPRLQIIDLLVHEVNHQLRPDPFQRIRLEAHDVGIHLEPEVHPEVSFWALAGEAMVHPKDHLAGYRERKGWLEGALGVALPDRAEAFKLVRPAKPDDVLDATVAAWTARRVVEGVAGRLPDEPERDEKGLRMEIVY